MPSSSCLSPRDDEGGEFRPALVLASRWMRAGVLSGRRGVLSFPCVRSLFCLWRLLRVRWRGMMNCSLAQMQRESFERAAFRVLI